MVAWMIANSVQKMKSVLHKEVETDSGFQGEKKLNELNKTSVFQPN